MNAVRKAASPPAGVAFQQPAEPPRLSAASSDAELKAALHRNGNLLRQVQTEAQQAHHRLMQNPHLSAAELGIAAFWAQAQWRFQAAMPRGQGGMPADLEAADNATVAAFRIIIDARDALRELEADIPLLKHGDLLALRGQMPFAHAGAALAAVWAKGPGLAAWQARRQAAAEEAQAIVDRQRAAQAASQAALIEQQSAEAALALVRRMAGAGVRLSVVKKELLAQPAALLSKADRAELMRYHDDVVAVLSAPAETIRE